VGTRNCGGVGFEFVWNGWARGGFINISIMSNNDVGKGGV
jgi:hypothetical protein